MNLDQFMIDDFTPSKPQQTEQSNDGPLRKNDIVQLNDIEYVLKRTSIFAGSTREELAETYIYEEDKIKFVQAPIIPALLKIIAEIISNSVDEAIRTNFQYATKIDVGFKDGIISVQDSGRGLPIEETENGKWTPEIIYTQMRAGSNFNDDGRTTQGLNGVGGAISAILSLKFSIDTANGIKRYTQTFENSLQKINKPKITKSEKNYTSVSFEPNYGFFFASEEVKTWLPVMIQKMVTNLSFCYPEITFTFNGKRIQARSLKSFLSAIHDVHECSETEQCRLGVFYSDTEFQQISFVNGLDMIRGGTHIDYVSGKIVEYLREYIKKKHKLDVKPIDIKSKLFIMFSMRMVNAQCDSQTKEKLTNPIADFRDIIDGVMTEKFLKTITKNEEIMFPIVESYRLKQEVKDNQELKKLSAEKKKIKVDKFLPASGKNKYLVLCEGDSAMGLISSVLGRKEFSYFPVKGKMLNTLEIAVSKLKENEEVKNLIEITGLRLDKDIQSLTHENILLATDSDEDGTHIKSLILCMFYRYGKSLFRDKKIKFLKTPLIIGKVKGKIKYFFFNLADYEKHVTVNKNENVDWKYVKGLGTNSKVDLKEIFEKHGFENFVETFELDEMTDALIVDWMGKKGADKRKEYMKEQSCEVD